MGSVPVICAFCGRANQPQARFCGGCGKALAARSGALTGALPAEHLLHGRYRLKGVVGAGAFGAVYQAEDRVLGNRKVAVKEMSQSGLSAQEAMEAMEAFQREALLLANLHHPNLPHIYDQFSEGGRAYLVMEFIEGETLEAYLNKAPGGRLATQEALQIGLQLCDVLEYLHSQQPPIIFRDLKPANSMLTPKGQVVLIDFGIARLFTPGKRRDTTLLGTPGYAAPEQYGKAQTTPQSDVYALGAVLHQLLSGSDPTADPFHFAPLGPVSPAGLEPLVMQMVALKREDRPASIAEVRQTLRVIAAGPRNSRDEWLEQGKALAAARKFQEALAAFEQAIQLDPNAASAHNHKAAALIELKRYHEALAACEQATRLDPQLVSAYNNTASALLGLKRYREALHVCDEALQRAPTQAPAHNSRAAALLGLKRFGEALAASNRAIELAPDLASAHSKKGRALLGLKRPADAALACQRAIQLDPEHVRAYLNWGLALLELRQYDGALKAFEQAIQLDPNKPPAHVGKGRALNNLARCDEALAAFERAIQLAPTNAHHYHLKGNVLWNLKRYQEALTAYERAEQIDPSFALAALDQGDTLSKLGRYQEALAAYERALQLEPQLARAHRGKGAALEQLGRSEEAQRAYAQARALRQAGGMAGG